MYYNGLNNINRLVLEKWDPIGVSNRQEAADEYHQYVHAIYQIIQNSLSYRDLFEYLWELETQYIGLKGNKPKTEEFARMLYKEIKKM